jgi:hypothetical protein
LCLSQSVWIVHCREEESTAETLTFIASYSQRGDADKEQSLHLIREALPKIVRAVLKKKHFENVTLIEAAREFLLRAATFAASLLPQQYFEFKEVRAVSSMNDNIPRRIVENRTTLCFRTNLFKSLLSTSIGILLFGVTESVCAIGRAV